ncbi:Uncharacterized protein TCM_026089 [Theobroma cacao]|uniref:Uncharacterized protein n=1 Tax=Theobroma cacao TaxID=3641 RepID=A0A061F164_THECC|nr:Uncharacterized protein TCM_026089 [Theobroma cacao]
MKTIHFQFNIGKTKVVAFAGLSNQNARVMTRKNCRLWLTPTNQSGCSHKGLPVGQECGYLSSVPVLVRLKTNLRAKSKPRSLLLVLNNVAINFLHESHIVLLTVIQ